MQYHLDGFRPGDPEAPPDDVPPRPEELPGEVDVLIVGGGPAGLVLAAQLSAFETITTRVVERRDGPLRLGQADGVACRTVEMFDAFGLSERLLREAYWVNETAFWRPDPADPSRIVRSGRIQDVEDGLSEFPHVIVNQARMQDFLLDVMRRSRLEPDYGLECTGLTVGDGDHPVRVTLRRDDGTEVVVRARYVVGCDGAHSAVRGAIGAALHGDAANQAWGVMDVLAVTDFPDWRLKTVFRDDAGRSMLLIPREGGYLARLYVELGDDPGPTGLDDIVAAARRILQPYDLDVRETAWWTVYRVGQRLCDRFDDLPAGASGGHPRVFVAGDACHTHSAKAGQGMNVSMQDGFNLGWKLAAVLRGQAGPELLRTYSAERRAVARELIEFDEEWNRVLEGDAERFQALFVQQGRFTAGVATRYAPSIVRGDDGHQNLAPGFGIGMRFHSAPVIRLADALPMHLGHVARADGRWRVYLFADAGDPGDPASSLARCCRYLADDVLPRFTPETTDVDGVLDVRAVLQQPHRDVDWGRLPALLRPAKGRLGLVDHEKVFCPDPRRGDVFDLRGVDRASGCVVLVRPDQYVAHVLPLTGPERLGAFLDGVLLPARAPVG